MFKLNMDKKYISRESKINLGIFCYFLFFFLKYIIESICRMLTAIISWNVCPVALPVPFLASSRQRMRSFVGLLSVARGLLLGKSLRCWQRVEERMCQSILQCDALSRLVIQHALHQIEQLSVLLLLRQHVSLQ